jgi:RimJ/RimL family protein N-acetyltransferase
MEVVESPSMTRPRRTDRLLLRPPTEADAQRMFEIFGDPRTNVHNPLGPYPDMDTARTMLAARIAQWRQHGFGQWAIAVRDAPDTLIGFGGVAYRQYLDEEKLNLGYRFATESWGHGYATELGEAALKLAFEDLAKPEVFALVRPDNLASARVLEKLGMQRSGDLDDVPGEARSVVYRIRRAAD